MARVMTSGKVKTHGMMSEREKNPSEMGYPQPSSKLGVVGVVGSTTIPTTTTTLSMNAVQRLDGSGSFF
jgi:hypothetical protein